MVKHTIMSVRLVRALVVHVRNAFKTQSGPVEIVQEIELRNGLLFSARRAIKNLMTVAALNIIYVKMKIGWTKDALVVYILAPHKKYACNRTKLVVRTYIKNNKKSGKLFETYSQK